MGQDLANAFAKGEKKKNIIWLFNSAEGAVSPKVLTEMKELFGKRLKNNALNAKDGAKSKIELALEASGNTELIKKLDKALENVVENGDHSLLNDLFEIDIQPVLDKMMEAGTTLVDLKI